MEDEVQEEDLPTPREGHRSRKPCLVSGGDREQSAHGRQGSRGIGQADQEARRSDSPHSQKDDPQADARRASQVLVFHLEITP